MYSSVQRCTAVAALHRLGEVSHSAGRGGTAVYGSVLGWSRRPLVPAHGRRAAPRDSTGWAAGGEGVLEGGVREK